MTCVGISGLNRFQVKFWIFHQGFFFSSGAAGLCDATWWTSTSLQLKHMYWTETAHGSAKAAVKLFFSCYWNTHHPIQFSPYRFPVAAVLLFYLRSYFSTCLFFSLTTFLLFFLPFFLHFPSLPLLHMPRGPQEFQEFHRLSIVLGMCFALSPHLLLLLLLLSGWRQG